MVILRTQNQVGPTKDKQTDAPNAGIIKSSFKGWEIVYRGERGNF